MSGKQTEQASASKRPEKSLGAAVTKPVSAEQVAAYLRQNPDFLKENPELLDAMAAPERTHGGGVVDLQQAMVERLRKELEKLRGERDALVMTSRNNLATATRIHQAVIALLAIKSFEELIEFITTDLMVILDLDAVVLAIENTVDGQQNVTPGGIKRLPEGAVEAAFGPQKQILLREEISGDPEIFGYAASLVRSDALIRLRISSVTPPALLAFGSRHADHFHDTQGTELLTFLGQSIELLIRAWLELPE